MTLDWMPRDNELKDHGVGGDAYWGTLETPPCAVYEKKPLRGPDGREIPDLHVAWVTLNNPKQFNSYTTSMVKGVTAAFANAGLDRSVVDFPTHYLAAPREIGRQLESEALLEMAQAFGFSLSGNLPYLVWLEKNYRLSEKIGEGKEATGALLESAGLDLPFVILSGL